MSDLFDGDVDNLADDDGGDHKTAIGGNSGSSLSPSYLRNRAGDRARLVKRIKLLIREINKPLAEIVRDQVLPRLPARSLLRLRAVASSWAQLASSPLFVHNHPQTHRSISGVFFHTFPNDSPAYAHFPPASAHAIPDPALSFIPDSPVDVLSSSNGLLLCHSHSSGAFFVCNPITAAWTAVPRPPIHTGNNPAAVLIFVPDVYNFRPDFTIVIAFKIPHSGFFGFAVFSSTVGDWWVSNEICEAERLFPSSGVAAGKVAYWRTSMSTVIGYEPGADKVLAVPWPMGHREGVHWEIGVMGGSGRLYSTSVTNTDVEIHKLVSESEGWALVDCVDVNTWREAEDTDGNQMVESSRAWPLRFQSGEMEILLWVSGKVVGINLASKRVRVTEAASLAPAGSPGIGGSDYVSYVSTLSPVPPSAGGGTEESAADARCLSNGT